MFDIQATIRWTTEVIKDPNAAAASYKESAAPWLQTFLQITLPVYVAAVVVGYILALITGGSLMYGGGSIGFVLFSLLWSLGWTFVVAFIFDFLAGTFEGTRDFNAAYALVGLAIIPAALGNAVAPLPVIGWLLSIAASIYSIVLAYRFVPIFLALPEVNRVKHFVISIIAALIVNLLVGATLGAMFLPSMVSGYSVGDPAGAPEDAGIFGGVSRQASFADAAQKDRYDPPADGELNDDQMEDYVDVLKKTQALRQRLTSKFENMEEDEASVSDILGGVGDAMRLGTAEMEVVKTGGGNWAEHTWVKNQVETARVQQDLNDTVKHNYALFLRYQDEIEQYE
jgi:hypothetical protein